MNCSGSNLEGGCTGAGPYGHKLLGIDHNQSKAIKSAVEKGFEGVKPGWTRVSSPYCTSNEEMEFVWMRQTCWQSSAIVSLHCIALIGKLEIGNVT